MTKILNLIRYNNELSVFFNINGDYAHYNDIDGLTDLLTKTLNDNVKFICHIPIFMWGYQIQSRLLFSVSTQSQYLYSPLMVNHQFATGEFQLLTPTDIQFCEAYFSQYNRLGINFKERLH